MTEILPVGEARRTRFSSPPRLEQRPQVVEAVEQVPDVGRRTVLPVGVQIGQFGIVAVTVEGVLRLPLDENQHLAWLDLAGDRFAELSEGDDAAAVLGHFLR